MKITDEKIKKVFEKGNEVVLATCSSDCKPNLNVVLSCGFLDDKFFVADCQMDATLKNLKETGLICVFAKNDGKYLRLKGEIEIFSSGKYFDFCEKPVSSNIEMVVFVIDCSR